MHFAAARRKHAAETVCSTTSHFAQPWRFELLCGPERADAERFIAQAYERAYQARVTQFLPTLAGVFRGPELLAACGLREASQGEFFLETYLDHPIEQRLADLTHAPVGRNRIVEVGNLAIARPGAARVLISLLTEHLTASRAEWAVFTAVPALRNNFRALRIPLLVVEPARAERLEPHAREGWGTYYECAPAVSAVRVAEAAKALRASA